VAAEVGVGAQNRFHVWQGAAVAVAVAAEVEVEVERNRY
jgi:hypothetical protein